MRVANYINPVAERSLLYGEGTSLGIVLKNQEETEKDNVIGVFIPRLMFGLSITNGAYDVDVPVTNTKCLNSKNTKLSSGNIATKNYLLMQVSQIGSIISPHFARGENVFVSNCDKDLKNMFVLPYSIGETNRRKQDKWSVLIPNMKEYPDQNQVPELTYNNTFGMQIDTINKQLTLWTSYEDGAEEPEVEKGAYMISMDAANGILNISDSGKRTITMNTEEDSITLMNEGESSIEIKEDTITLTCKHFVLDSEEDIKITSSKMEREIDEIKSKGKTDEEEYDTLKIKGNELDSNYNTTKIESSSYENKTSQWKVDSPISGFTKILTANEFDIWSNAGTNPLPTCAQISSAGIAKFGNPNAKSLGLAIAQPLIVMLLSIGAKVDAIGSVVGCPPTCVTAVSAGMMQLTSMNAMG